MKSFFLSLIFGSLSFCLHAQLVGNNSDPAFDNVTATGTIKNTNSSTTALNSFMFVNAQNYGGAQIAYIPTGGVGNIGGVLTLATKNTTNAAWSEGIRLMDGRVGIGTTNPIARLHMYGSGQNTQTIQLESSMNNANAYTVYKNNNQGYISGLSGDISNNYIVYDLNANLTRMSIAPNGNVGIGTTAPSEKLSVSGNIAAVAQNSGYVFLNPDDGAFEIGSGNNEVSYIDFKGSGNLNTDAQGRFSYNDYAGFDFSTGGNFISRLRIGANGNVGIGTTNIADAQYQLFVEKGIRTRAVKVDRANWPDYVFKPEYKLRPIHDLEGYIKLFSHLPDVPSAQEVEKDGLDLGATQAVLLKKIEELTLYVIQQDKKNLQLQRRVEQLESKSK